MAYTIQLFQPVQKYYQTLGIESHQNSLFNFRNLFAIFCFLMCFTSTLAFFLFKANTILEYGATFYAFISETYILYFLFVQMWQMANISKLIASFENLIKERLRAKMVTYDELNVKIDKMCDLIYFVLVDISLVGFFLPCLLITVINYFVYDLNEKSYILATPAIFPYNWRTPFGYLIAIIVQGLSVYYTTLLNTAIITFFVGSIWMFESFLKDITSDLTLLNIDKTWSKKQKTSKNHFCTVIQLYLDVKQLVDEFNVIYEFMITGSFLWTLICITSSLLVLQTQLSEQVSNLMDLITPLTELVWSFALIAFYSEFSQIMCHQFILFSEELDRCDWYLLPIELQRTYLIFLFDAQQVTIVRGYGNILCTRDTFKKTTNTAFSYFMMLRSINA